MNRDAEAGMTLVETLVVLMIVSVMITVSMGQVFTGATERAVKLEAERFAASLQRAGDRALITGEQIWISWDRRGYAFHNRAGDLLAEHTLPSELDLYARGRLVAMTVPPDGTGGPASWQIIGHNAKWEITFDGLAARAMVTP